MCWHPAKHIANPSESSGFAVSLFSKSWSLCSKISFICEMETLIHATSVQSAMMESGAVV